MIKSGIDYITHFLHFIIKLLFTAEEIKPCRQLENKRLWATPFQILLKLISLMSKRELIN